MEENNEWASAAEMREAKKFRRIGLPSFKYLLSIALVLSGLVICKALWESWNRNTLDFSDSKLTSLPIALVNASNTIYGTKSFVPVRAKQLADYPSLYKHASYVPSSFLITLVHDDAPWRSLKSELYRYLGTQDGIPAEGLSLLNPLLLIFPKFYSKEFFAQEAPKAGEPLDQIGKALSLVYNPSQKSVTLSCNVSEPLEHRFGKNIDTINLLNFGLVTYNALDLGYRKAMVMDSINVNPSSTELESLITFIGYSKDGCGPDIGCNTLTMAPAKFQKFQMTNFPAKLVLGLWQNENVDPKEQKPDLTYIIELQ